MNHDGLYDMFVGQATAEEIASMDLDLATKQVGELRDGTLPLTDRELAQIIIGHAQKLLINATEKETME